MTVTTGFVGFFFFRNNPFLLMLSLIAGYVGYAGYRNSQLREKRAGWFDILIAAMALVVSVGFVLHLWQTNQVVNVTIIATCTALVLVTSYDLLKFFLLHHYLKSWWLYEHIYKMISSFSALASAFSGNVLRDYQPMSQVGPSVICTLMVVYFVSVRARRTIINPLSRGDG